MPGKHDGRAPFATDDSPQRRTLWEAALHGTFISGPHHGRMSTGTNQPLTTVHGERTCECPFSMAESYTVDYLKQAEKGGPEAFLRVPLFGGLPALRWRVQPSFGIAIDVVEEGRRHDEIRLRWTSGSRLFPNFRGTVRFRIDQTFTRVLVDGSYVPPLGPIGATFDRWIGRHIAARSLDDLAGRIARALERREREWEAKHPAAAS